MHNALRTCYQDERLAQAAARCVGPVRRLSAVLLTVWWFTQTRALHRSADFRPVKTRAYAVIEHGADQLEQVARGAASSWGVSWCSQALAAGALVGRCWQLDRLAQGLGCTGGDEHTGSRVHERACPAECKLDDSPDCGGHASASGVVVHPGCWHPRVSGTLRPRCDSICGMLQPSSESAGRLVAVQVSMLSLQVKRSRQESSRRKPQQRALRSGHGRGQLGSRP